MPGLVLDEFSSFGAIGLLDKVPHLAFRVAESCKGAQILNIGKEHSRPLDGLRPFAVGHAVSAPSNETRFLTPLTWPSWASCWSVRPDGETISRSGRIICLNEPASRAAAAERAALPLPAPPGGGCMVAVYPPAPSTISAPQPATPRRSSARASNPEAVMPLRGINLCRISRPNIGTYLNNSRSPGAISRRNAATPDIGSRRRLPG